MIGFVIVVGGTAAFVAVAKFFNQRDAECLARTLPPAKRPLVSERTLPNYVA